MSILLKYVLRFVKENKFRTILLIFTVAISGAMIYSMLSVKDSLEDVYIEKFSALIGEADIIISASEEAEDQSVDFSVPFEMDKNIIYVHDVVDSMGIYEYDSNKHKMFRLMGISLENYMEGFDLTLLENSEINKFEGDQIIISDYVSKYYDISLGDQVSVYVGSDKHSLEVVGIAASTGLFLDESIEKKAIIPYDTLNGWLSLNGSPNKIYINLAEKYDIDTAIDYFTDMYPDYEINEALSQDDIKNELDKVSFSISFSALMGSFMCIFIIYSSFKVILYEQLPQIGTFRSIGADKRKIRSIMLLEGVIYGVIGGVLGSILGVGISYIIVVMSVPQELKEIVNVGVNVNIVYILVSMVLSVTISTLGILLPIQKVSKIPIKNIVLNIENKQKQKSSRRLLFYIPVLIVTFIIPYVTTNKQLYGPIAILAIIVGFLVIIKLLPVFLSITLTIIKGLIRRILGNVGELACINVKTSSTFLNSITLITIGISITLMMNVISQGMTVIIVDAVADMQNYDITVSFSGINEMKAEKLKDIEHIEESYLAYSVADVEVENQDSAISLVEGVSDLNYFKFRKLSGIDDALFEKLKNGNNIILTETLKKRYQLEEEDNISLILNDTKVTYHIIGFIDTYMTAGSFGMVSMNSLMDAMDESKYSDIYLRVDSKENVEKVADELAFVYENEYTNIEITDDFLAYFKDTMYGISFMIQALSMLAILIGFIGIVNNQLLSFVERQRSIAVFKSIGMSKMQTIKMLFVESLIVGFSGGLIGILGAFLFVNIVPMFFEMADYVVPLKMSIRQCALYVLSASLVTIASTVTIAFKSAKFNIIASIKSE